MLQFLRQYDQLRSLSFMPAILDAFREFCSIYQCTMVHLYVVDVVLTILKAQVNLTLMNWMAWGTRNTNIAYGKCQANMGWFTTTLKTTYSKEWKALNTLAVSTLMGAYH
jgi:hypothetical protein